MTDFTYSAKDAVLISVLKDAFGEAVTLDDGGKEKTYDILSEFRLGESEYAVLQEDGPGSDAEVLLLRITRDQDGNLELESIDDDDEWEAIAEVYDEMTFEP